MRLCAYNTRRVVLYVVHCSSIVDARRTAAAQPPIPVQPFDPEDAVWVDMFDSSDEEELGLVVDG